MTDADEIDEVGPPLLPSGPAVLLSEIVRRVNSAGCALDEVVVTTECNANLELDWARAWVESKAPVVSIEQLGLADDDDPDPTEGW